MLLKPPTVKLVVAFGYTHSFYKAAHGTEHDKKTQSSSSWRTAGGPVDKSLVKRPRTRLQHLYCIFYLDDITLNKIRCFPDA